MGAPMQRGTWAQTAFRRSPAGNIPPLEAADLGGTPRWLPQVGAGERQRESACSLSAAAPVMGGSQMAEAVGLAHMASLGLGPDRGHRGLRITELWGWGHSIYRLACGEV